MKRLLLFALVAAAAWYGWKHQAELRSRGTHEILAVNRSEQALERVRISVAGEAFAIEALAPGASTRLALRSEQDGLFDVSWNVHGTDGERRWSGGTFTHGPVLMRHRLEFTSGDGVIWSSERMGPDKPRGR